MSFFVHASLMTTWFDREEKGKDSPSLLRPENVADDGEAAGEEG